MATTPASPRIPEDIERDTDVIASDDAREASPVDPAGDDQPTLEDAAGTDDEDVTAEAPSRGTRDGR